MVAADIDERGGIVTASFSDDARARDLWCSIRR
jgi:hypothetical protein